MTPNLDLGDTRAIIKASIEASLLRNQCAYVLATAYVETAYKMKPVRETLAATTDQAIARLETAWRRGRLPWVKKPYWRKDATGRSWLGRGYPQMTHERNYRNAENKLGVDLTTDPEVVMETDIAIPILIRGMVEGWFTGKRLDDFITLKASLFVRARSIINGTDRAQEIAGIARAYDKALRAEGYGVSPPILYLSPEQYVAFCRKRTDLPLEVQQALASVRP